MEAGSNGEKRVSDLVTPAMLVDKAKVRANCAKILAACTEMGVTLRAQTKTHKTIEGAVLQTGDSRRGLVTSTLQEAEFYAEHGFDDILFGYPFIPCHMPRVEKLAKRLDKFHVMIDSRIAVDTLTAHQPPSNKRWSVFLSVNCGCNREGVWWESEEAEDLALQVHEGPYTTLAGVYVHCGNSYNSSRPGDVERVREETIERMVSVAERIRGRGVPCPAVGIGSTPTCSRPSASMRRLTELHPGNYIFYDAQQVTLGSCKEEEVACCVATKIIGHHPDRNQMLIDCGFCALTKQGIGQLPSGCCIIRGHPNLKLNNMTQEIGFIDAVEGRIDFEKHPIGSMLFLLPWHSCATAVMFPEYQVVEGDVVVEVWRPTRGW